MELEVFPHDPLNEGFGFAVVLKSRGKVVHQSSVSENDAYELVADVLTFVTERS